MAGHTLSMALRLRCGALRPRFGVSGGGDFGLGFYTFADTRWGEESAWDWAMKKADGSSQPILVRVKMPENEYLALNADYVSPDGLDAAYQLYYQFNLTGYELVCWGR